MINLRFLLFTVVIVVFSNPLYARGNKFPDFTHLVEDVAPAVVNISATRTSKKLSQRSILEDFFRHGRPSEGSQEAEPSHSSEGSGFIISEDGYVLTNRHVVLLADEITVRMNDGREFLATLIGEDNGTDVALLKIEAESLPVIPTGNSEQLKVGEWVLGFGAPFGFDHTVTAGIVSAKRRTLGGEQYVPYIQTDVAINPGNSGGPLVSMDGKVVGINSQILSRSGGYIGISFSIPIELALNVAEQFKEYGKVHRGYLGVQYQEVTYALAQTFNMNKVEGALLTQVTTDSVAEKAGLKRGDIVLKFNDKRVHRAGELPFIVGLIKPGSTVDVDIVRDGERMQLELTVGERPDLAVATSDSKDETETSSLGLVIGEITKEIRAKTDSEGVIVTQITRGPASRAGIRRGDIILSMANNNIDSVERFKKVLSSLPKGTDVSVLILRSPGIHRFLTLHIPE